MSDTPMLHDWVRSTLGHGDVMCSRCLITNREAAVFGRLNECKTVRELSRGRAQKQSEKAMTDLVERLRNIAGHDWRISHLAHTGDTAKEAATALEAKDKEIEALRLEFTVMYKEFDVRNAENTELQVRAETAERRVAELEAALKPFAAQAECWPEIPDNQAMMTSNGEDLSSIYFLMSDIRAARAVIKQGE